MAHKCLSLEWISELQCVPIMALRTSENVRTAVLCINMNDLKNIMF